MARNRSNANAWTPNQIVAYRVAEARRMRGWTQEQAASELEPYLGTKLSNASFSAIERSFAGGRVRQFNADEILALARGFRLPIGWFFTPPPVFEHIDISAPDDGGSGWEPLLMIDAILGNPDTLAEWEQALQLWSVSPHRHPDGTCENLGREVEDVHDGIGVFIKARTRLRLGELFGDVERAKEVLSALAVILDEGTDASHTEAHRPSQPDTSRHDA
ncbi:MAG: helix-turn-helix transcriptional regulator [Actinomycetia bacterium]|nr:helix-turn-helix transcriptional regulator [Actinomycetes bacterium]MCP3910285.1 helix-turn-helix transcriptional regulator [Actinomycetes bacterium]MCP4084977.1 helix-turn-helix transcriptional regulator [Actinomycetes bacterium]